MCYTKEFDSLGKKTRESQLEHVSLVDEYICIKVYFLSHRHTL